MVKSESGVNPMLFKRRLLTQRAQLVSTALLLAAAISASELAQAADATSAGACQFGKAPPPHAPPTSAPATSTSPSTNGSSPAGSTSSSAATGIATPSPTAQPQSDVAVLQQILAARQNNWDNLQGVAPFGFHCAVAPVSGQQTFNCSYTPTGVRSGLSDSAAQQLYNNVVAAIQQAAPGWTWQPKQSDSLLYVSGGPAPNQILVFVSAWRAGEDGDPGNAQVSITVYATPIAHLPWPL